METEPEMHEVYRTYLYQQLLSIYPLYNSPAVAFMPLEDVDEFMSKKSFNKGHVLTIYTPSLIQES